ncbi:MAG: DNA mismatch repair protein MutS [Acidobacteriota bacterium]
MDRRRQSASIADDYRARLAARQATVAALDGRHWHFGNARLALLAAGVGLVAWRGWAGSAPWLGGLALGFGALAVAHARLLNARDAAARAVAHYTRALARLEDRWAGLGDPGERFRDEAHPYADDLDLFGRGGVFDLLSTPRTAAGEAALARWLLSAAPPAEVVARQAAVAELTPRTDLREDLAVRGPDVRRTVATDLLTAWATAPPVLTARWPRAVLGLLAAVTGALVAWWIWSGSPPAGLPVVLALQGLVAWRYRRGVKSVEAGLERRERELEVLATILGRLEREPAASRRLAELQAGLSATGHRPSEEIARLARLVDLLTSRRNQIFGPIAALFAAGTQLAFAVDGWRLRCGAAVPRWLDLVGEYEALVALAAYAAEHPDTVFPDIVDGPARFEGADLRHPLLPAASAVPNDVRLGGDGPALVLVSGSNMAGKSTLLRTVGLAAVFAQAGAPVAARALRLSPLSIGATLRIQDSLLAGRSRFFAEITRLARVVELAKTGPTLFLLDELLSGTNSHDRRHGAEAILGGLLDLGAIGLVTTHDLALAEIADALAPRAANSHFEDRFEGDVLHFDYRLKPGVVRTSNALALMRSVGLRV